MANNAATTNTPVAKTGQPDKAYERFTLGERIQHVVLMVAFTVLALTGLPQLFAGAGWAQVWMSVLGGIDGTRLIHHMAGAVLICMFVYHMLNLLIDLIFSGARRMLPGVQDAKDAIHEVRYLLGKRPDKPQYDRFDFRQKVEYWALIWGTILMGLTGLILMFPVVAARFMPGVVIYAAKAAHGLEATLAILSIIVWHMYNTHFLGGKFAFDTTIFTGQISEERLQEEHPLEYQRLLAESEAAPSTADSPESEAAHD